MKILIIGYGNPSRRDDGVGLAAVNGLRRRLGLPFLQDNDDGFADLGHDVDTLFVQQMMPELAETLACYDVVYFVDAHVGVYPELIRRTPLMPDPERAFVSHHVKPGELLDIARRLYGRAPAAELISIRGFDFNFGEQLSPSTAKAVAQVVDELWQRMQG
jgi:hydrogenase maturation protease